MATRVARQGGAGPPPNESDLERISTGNASADAILGGGFPDNTINIVMGQPGTGKTIFVEQILFTNAGPDRPVLFFTTLSEPLPKVVRFVQAFGFYEESKIGTEVLYQDIGAELAEKGIAALIPLLKEAIRTLSPAVIVIDSFKALHDLSESALEFRQLVHKLTGLLTAYQTTTFLVGEYHQEEIRHHPEFAVADGVVELSRRPLGNRDERYFRVLKLRGSHYLEGSHAFEITEGGLDIHPRLVTPRLPLEFELAAGQVSTGVPSLDEMLHGGLTRGSTTLVIGPSGSGKTTLALQFALDGVRRGESSLCVNFQENPTQLARTVGRLAGDPETAAALEIMYWSPVELQIDSIVVQLFERIEKSGIRRVVLDAVGDLAASTSEPHRLHDYLYALIQHLAVSGITSVFTVERLGLGSPAPGSFHEGPVSYMADNLVLLDMRGDESTRRTLRVLKTRNSGHDPAVREMTIGSDGIQLS